MNNVEAYKTELTHRTLFSDGDSVAEMALLYERILAGEDISSLYVSKDDFNTPEITEYNKRFKTETIRTKSSINLEPTIWNIPSEFKDIELDKYLAKVLLKEKSEYSFTSEEFNTRIYRVKMELRLWEDRNLLDMLRVLIFIVNTFEEQDIVWGTGRGSSCASYILYLIGIHQIDSVEYDIDISEFFR